jgi:hypothetical protein
MNWPGLIASSPSYQPLRVRAEQQTIQKVTLVCLTYEHACSKDTILQQVFIYPDTQDHHHGSPSFTQGMSRFSSFGSAPASQKREPEGAIDSFAEYLFDNFFLPCMYG